MELNIPAVETAAGILLYLVDRDAEQSIYEVDFNPLPDDASRSPEVGLECIDHLTFHTAQNDVHSITQLFEHLFNFKEIYYPSYSARDTSPGYRALTSPCGEIRIRFQQPPAADKSTAQPARQSRLGIQHIALRSQDICHSVEALRSRDVPFVDSPEPSLPTRLDRLHRACGDIDRLRQNRIRIQAGPMYEYGRDDAVLRISTGCLIGPLYFEVIQRSCVDG
jgi:4-hydroxyphenylpyruvate dioxygenase